MAKSADDAKDTTDTTDTTDPTDMPETTDPTGSAGLTGQDAPARSRAEAGMATAEYAIGTVAAAAFAGLLLVILRGDAIRAALEGLISQALSIG